MVPYVLLLFFYNPNAVEPANMATAVFTSQANCQAAGAAAQALITPFNTYWKITYVCATQ
jgi:hypothetical protein